MVTKAHPVDVLGTQAQRPRCSSCVHGKEELQSPRHSDGVALEPRGREQHKQRLVRKLRSVGMWREGWWGHLLVGLRVEGAAGKSVATPKAVLPRLCTLPPGKLPPPVL